MALMTKKDLKFYGIIFILLALLILSLRQCREEKALRKQSEANTIFIDSFDTYKNKQGEIFAIQNQIIAHKNSQLANMVQEIEGIKKIKSQYKFQLETIIDSVFIPIDNPIYIDTFGDKYLKVPYPFEKINKWYELKGMITDTGLFASLFTRSEPVITLGDAVKKFPRDIFKKRRSVVVYHDNNPYVEVIDMNNITIHDNRKNSRFSIQLQGGYGILVDLNNGSVGKGIYGGFGMGYDLIRF